MSHTGSDIEAQAPSVQEFSKSEKVQSRESRTTVEQATVEELLPPHNALQRWAVRLEGLVGLEARGIERVPKSIRMRKTTLGDYIQMMLIWFSSNLTLNNLLLGLLGPTVFGVGLKDGMVLATFGCLLGAFGVAFISTFGPLSGNRTMVICRFNMGWWPSRICVLLNIVIMVGYGLTDTLIAGQILSAISGGHLSVVVGVIICSLITLAVVVFGIDAFHLYERYAFVPQLPVLFILIGVAGTYFDTSTPTVGDATIQSADRMSFFFLCVSGALAWAAAAADFYVYYPPDANRLKILAATTSGLGLSCVMTSLIGVGIASGIASNSSWSTAYESGAGALIVECFRPLGAFGSFCSVILSLGLIANNVPGTYSAALSFQLFGPWLAAVPRLFWTVVCVVIYTVLACVGKDKLYEIFTNFLGLMGYWTSIWVFIILEEDFLFRRRGLGYDWSAWNTRKALPIGLAALTAFLVGWVGAVLGMYQTYFTGPLAKLVGDGIDMGIPVGVSWAALIFAPLRWLELKYIGR